MKTTSSASPDNSVEATPGDTLQQLLQLSGRGYSQFRHILVQLPDTEDARASTLARMVSERRHRELLLYMLLLSCWPWLSTRDEPLAAGVWARALTAKDGLTWSGSTLSRSWRRLEELGLIEERERQDRLVRVTPRREDAQEPYTPPGGRDDRWNTYFTLPDAFWRDEWFAKLKLPGLAVLLVVAGETSNKQECRFTYNRMDDWYGLKARTVQNGVQELRNAEILHVREEVVKAPLSATGKTTRVYYSLRGEFSYTSRAALQKVAQRETAERQTGK